MKLDDIISTITGSGPIGLVIVLLGIAIGIIFIKQGYKRGAMAELKRLLGVVVALVCIILILVIRRSAADQKYATVIVVSAAVVILGLGWKATRLILGLLSGLTGLPILGGLDRLAGAVMGAAECAGLIWIVFQLYSIWGTS